MESQEQPHRPSRELRYTDALAHQIVTRFSVPRHGYSSHAGLHTDPEWLNRRFDLFRTYFVPSVERLGVPTILLCSATNAPLVEAHVADLDWVRIEVQEDWRGGWTGAADDVLTRMDSDDALHEDWFKAVDGAPLDADAVCTLEFLRLDPSRGRLAAYRRRGPSPLAAFRGGRNAYAYNHTELQYQYRVHLVEGPYLLQIFHGGNLANHRPSWYRPRLPLDRLRPFGLDPGAFGR